MLQVALWVVGILVVLVLGGMLYMNRGGLDAVTLRTITAYRIAAVGLTEEKFDVRLDASEESFKVLDEVLERVRSDREAGTGMTDKKLDEAAKMWGAYVGEVIRRRFGGTWSMATEGPFAGMFTLNVGGTQLAPHAKVMKRVLNGEEDSIAAYYQVFKQTVGESEPSS